MKSKLRAFTIVETVIAMGISSLVISISYAGFGLVSQMYGNFKQSSDRISEIVLLDRILTEDFSNAELIIRDDNKVTFTFPDKNIEYLFEKEFILRRGVQADTFFLSPDHLIFEEVDKNHSGSLVNAIGFTNVYKDMEESFNYMKVYSASTMINFNKQE